MPKLTTRCKRFHGWNVSEGSVAATVAPPRKVSFEDGHQDAPALTQPTAAATTAGLPRTSSSLSLLPVLTGESKMQSSRRATLIRPTTSQCLVELANSGEDFLPEQETSSDEFKHVAPVSPVPQDSVTLGSQSLSPTSQPSSPDVWGQFVDMTVPGHDKIAYVASFSPFHRHDAPCSCSSCRRRREYPYGDYVKKRARLCFHQRLDDDAQTKLRFPSSVPTDLPTTKLLPRKQRQHTDNLIHTFQGMRVD